MYYVCDCCLIYHTTGPLEYNAQSPDEAALVSAARNFGYVFLVMAAGVTSLVVSLLFTGSYTLLDSYEVGQQEYRCMLCYCNTYGEIILCHFCRLSTHCYTFWTSIMSVRECR